MGGIPWNITINSTYVDTLILRQKVNSILTDFNNIASTYIDDSEITKLNQSQLGSIHLSAELCYLLDKSIEYCDLSDGYYDVTVMPLVNLWNFGYENNDLEYPTTMQVNQALKHVNCKQLSLLKCDLQKNQNMNIDLSSIAKGYAVERINTAEVDATLFELVLAEYKKAPQINKDRYFIETMDAILKGVPNKVIVDTELENFLPMLNLKNKENR